MKSNLKPVIKNDQTFEDIQSVTALATILDEIDEKRRSELIRFRTCCADPRASK